MLALPADYADHLVIEAQCSPSSDDPLHSFELTAKWDGQAIGSLTALRYSLFGFSFEGGTSGMVWSFDHHTQASYDLAEAVHDCRRPLRLRFGGEMACGIIAIMQIYVEPAARGNKLGLELVRHLRELHLGLPWFACMEARPYEFKRETAEHRQMQERLISHYMRDAELGFAPARIGSTVLVAFWDEAQE